MLKPYVQRLVFVNKEREIWFGKKVKTFFRDQHLSETKIKKTETYSKRKLFLVFIYNLETISRSWVRNESDDATYCATTIAFQVFCAIMLKNSLADLDKKVKIKLIIFCLAGELVFIINNVFRFVQILASRQQ